MINIGEISWNILKAPNEDIRFLWYFCPSTLHIRCETLSVAASLFTRLYYSSTLYSNIMSSFFREAAFLTCVFEQIFLQESYWRYRWGASDKMTVTSEKVQFILIEWKPIDNHIAPAFFKGKFCKVSVCMRRWSWEVL